MDRIRQSPTDPEFVQDPYAFYRAAQESGDFVWWEDYGLACAVSRRAVDTVLKEKRMGRAPLSPQTVPDHSADFYALEANSMLELEPPRHTRLRGLVLRAFTSRRIAALGPEIETLCHRLIDAFPRESFDLLPAYAQEVPVIVIARLLGVPEEMRQDLLRWSNDMVAMYQARRTTEIELRANAAARDFAAFVRAYAEERRGRPSDDLITHLLAAEEDGTRLTPDELVTTCILLLNAGHEATVHTIGNGVKALLDHGQEASVLSADQADGAIEEILRYDPPLHMFTRHVYAPVEILGHRFDRGDRIACLLAAANRDGTVWHDPDRFDPVRGTLTNHAFGAGIHFCVGAPLARLELRVALRTLMSRCPDLRLASAPRYADLYHFHGLERLEVIV